MYGAILINGDWGNTVDLGK